MKFGSKYSSLDEQVIYIEKSKLNIDDMWLIPLDRVTYEISFKNKLKTIQIENVLGEHRSTTLLALELSKVSLYSVQNLFWFPVLFLIAYLSGHLGFPKERSFKSLLGENWNSYLKHA